ncbi:hypothetical protein SBRY_60007 [Actinacidiphila bryophytorum]|uniref:Uncharacterized protein n=1 Tax=Actinacidiphila bryophytorum TaxID=1436133 RepID=A0A9W4MIZ9_9ACTN|nr:hypothetical protein SBRY_60007 [Actinacidiphila bryophytorum]
MIIMPGRLPIAREHHLNAYGLQPWAHPSPALTRADEVLGRGNVPRQPVQQCCEERAITLGEPQPILAELAFQDDDLMA